MSPQRIQRKRTKGWRMPEGAVFVGRPSKWGNPYLTKGWNCTPETAVAQFRDMLQRAPVTTADSSVYTSIKRHLGGKDLACWCPLDQPCHADVLLEIANQGRRP